MKGSTGIGKPRRRPLLAAATSATLAGAGVLAALAGWSGANVAIAQSPFIPSASAPSADPAEEAGAPAPAPTTRDGVQVPSEAITPLIHCYLDSGLYISEVHQPPVPGATPFFVYGSSIGDDAGWEAMLACSDRYGSNRVLTDDEVREVYTRWVDERECLIRLGYQPQEPPSEETFVEQWKTGPWMPIDGVPYSAWTDEEYRTAKVQCGLEMYDR